jgi:hypoxanthine phosphoribosyltransferase
MRKKIVTFDENGLAAAAAELMGRMVADAYMPDLIVGIATGGLRVAEMLPRPENCPVIGCTVRRATSSGKAQSRVFRGLVRRLPYVITNQLRRIEDTSRERSGRSAPVPSGDFQDALATIDSVVREPEPRRVVIVDDAVDSGGTLSLVQGALQHRLPTSVALRTAVLAVTRPHQSLLVQPDYHLYDMTLCRFPWSHDFHGA